MDRRDLPWHFLINPAAARGRKRKRWERDFRILQAELPRMTWAESRAEPGMAALAEAAVRAGHQFLVGVGGDGTHHDILNGIIAAGGLERVTYCPFPSGTGNDWVRTLGVPHGLRNWLETLRRGKTIAHRVGHLKMTDRERYFLNVAGMAYDAEVVRRSEGLRYKHRLFYPFLTLAFLRGFTAPTVRIEYNGETFTVPVHTVNFGIGRYSGGGMRLVPHADPAADTLALTFARRLPVWKILAESWRFYTGTIGAVREVTLAHAEEVTVTPLAGRLELEADGEWLGTGPV
ncbi:MAG: diacylglycerol kinase family protein, partial [Bacteroidota bacterium]